MSDTVTKEEAELEVKNANRYRSSFQSLAADDRLSSPIFDKVRDALKVLLNN